MQHTSSQSRTRAIWILALSRAVSMFGSEAAFVATMALVWQRTHSARWTSGIVLACALTAAVATPLAGSLADRFPRRAVMIAAECAGAACFAAMFVVHSLWWYALVFAGTALAGSPFGSALQAAIPAVATDAELPRANALLNAGRMLGQLVGPLVGGLFVAWPGARFVFALNTLSYLASAAAIASIRMSLEHHSTRSTQLRHPLRELVAGVERVWTDVPLRLLASAWIVMCFGFGLVVAADLPLAVMLHAGAVGYGAIGASFAVGGLIGAIPARLVGERWRGGGPLIATSTLCVVAFVVVAAAPDLAIVLVGVGLIGVALAISSTVDMAIVQRRTPDHIRGRVTGCTDALNAFAFGAGLFVAGSVIPLLGARAPYLMGALCEAISIPAMFALWRLLAVERLPHAHEWRVLVPRESIEEPARVA